VGSVPQLAFLEQFVGRFDPRMLQGRRQPQISCSCLS
jgi:hypothetical protein